MSNDSNDDKKSKGGYGNPPRQHQFKPGQSGNRRGRPRRRKTERAFTTRQIRRDILSITEEPIYVNTSSGRRRIPAFRALLLSIRERAFKGHGPSQRLLLSMHSMMVREHELAHAHKFLELEEYEIRTVLQDEQMEPEEVEAIIELLNRLRRMTRNL